MSFVDVVLRVKNAGLKTGLEQAKQSVAGFKNSAGGMLAGAFSVGAIAVGVKSLIDEFSRIKDLSDRFGESSESIQRVSQAASLAGSDIEKVAVSVGKATKNAIAAADGNEKMNASFKKLGINAADFVNLKMEDKLIAISGGMMNVNGEGERLALAYEVLGKSGAEIMPLLIAGPEALTEAFRNANVASDETVSKLEEIGDTIEGAGNTLKVYLGGLLAWAIGGVQDFGFVLGAIISVNIERIGMLGDAIRSLMSGDFAEAKESLGAVFDSKTNSKKITDLIAAGRADRDQEKEAEARAKQNAAKAQAAYDPMESATEDKAAAKDADRILALREKIAQQEMDALSREERILALKEKVQNLSQTPLVLNEEAMLERQVELNDAKSALAKEEKQATQEAQQREENLIQLRKQVAQQEFDRMTKEEKIAALAKEADALGKSKPGDEKSALEGQVRLNDIAAQLSDLMSETVQQFQVDSVRQMGGSLNGVNYNALVNTEGQKTNDLLTSANKTLSDILRKEIKVQIPVAK